MYHNDFHNTHANSIRAFKEQLESGKLETRRKQVFFFIDSYTKAGLPALTDMEILEAMDLPREYDRSVQAELSRMKKHGLIKTPDLLDEDGNPVMEGGLIKKAYRPCESIYHRSDQPVQVWVTTGKPYCTFAEGERQLLSSDSYVLNTCLQRIKRHDKATTIVDKMRPVAEKILFNMKDLSEEESAELHEQLRQLLLQLNKV